MLDEVKIDGVALRELKKIRDDRGMVMHMVRSDSDLFKGFGEIYFSVTNPGVTKAWKKHLQATQLFAVPQGKMKIVMFDAREGSKTRGQIMETILGVDQYRLLKIPPGIWYGFQAVSLEPAMIANCCDLKHDPAEQTSLPLDSKEIPYRWGST